MSSDLARPLGQRVLWLYGRKLLIVCNCYVRFGVYRHCNSGDMIFLIYCVTSRDHVFKGLCDFISRNFSKKDPPCHQFGGHRRCGRQDITYLIFHVTLQDHVIKGPCDFMEGSSVLYIPTLPNLVGIMVMDA